MAEEILPDFYRIEIPLPKNPLKTLNSYVLKSSDRNLIIDTGFNRKECLEAMLAGLKKLDIDLNRTDFFITHLHADHFGLVAELKTETSTIYFNRPDSEILEGHGGFEEMLKYAGSNGFPEGALESAFKNHPGHKYGTQWLPVLKILKDGDKINIGNYTLNCVETPGHTLGHTCLYEPDNKIFISGDHILIDITPNIQGWSDDQNPLQLYLDSLDKVYDYDVKLVLPGHRRLFEDFRGRIDELKKHHEKRLNEVISILSEGGKNAFQVASKMSWDLKIDSWDEFPIPQQWFATGEAIAHLRCLEENDALTSEVVENKKVYSLINAG